MPLPAAQPQHRLAGAGQRHPVAFRGAAATRASSAYRTGADRAIPGQPEGHLQHHEPARLAALLEHAGPVAEAALGRSQLSHLAGAAGRSRGPPTIVALTSWP